MPKSERQVKREVTLHASRDEVWRALTDPDQAEQWLADDVELDLCEGGEVVFRYEGEDERRGHVEEILERERLRIRWRRDSRSESEVEFVLADAATGTRLIVTESVAAVGSLASGAGPSDALESLAACPPGWGDRLLALEVLTLSRGAVTLVAA